MSVDKRFATHDPAEIDRILRTVESVYIRMIREGKFDFELFHAMKRGQTEEQRQ